MEVAKRLNTEVLSADSRQFYKGMYIGTAKPSLEELRGVPHHFFDFLELDAYMSAGAFEEQALALLEKLFEKHDRVIMTGGSGLYMDAVCHGFDELPAVDPAIRNELNRIWDAEGLEPLLAELEENDPATYSSIDQNNAHRIIRALEIWRATGESISKQQKGKRAERPFHIQKFGIEMDRDALYKRINARVDKMMEAGLLEEVRNLLPYRSLNALNTVGYKELLNHLDENSTLEEAVELIKRNTRRYAKRQMTWWRKDEEIKWVEAQDVNMIMEILDAEE